MDDLLIVKSVESPVRSMEVLLVLAVGENVGTVARLNLATGGTVLIARLWIPGRSVGVYEQGFRRVETFGDTPEGNARAEALLRSWMGDLVAAHERALGIKPKGSAVS